MSSPTSSDSQAASPARLPDGAHIGYAHLRVSSLTRSLEFYADAIGFHEMRRSGPVAELSADGHTTHLILTEDRDAPERRMRSIGLYHTAIRLPDRTALANLFRRLVMREVPFQGFSDHLVSEALYLPDPDGLGVELYRDRPRAEWRMRDHELQMASLPLNVEALLADADDTRWTGIAPGADIGHMHLHVRDLRSAEAFYVDTLGFDVVTRAYPGALFVSAGGYHHHIGLNTWAGQARSPDGAIGLIEFSVTVPDAADVATVRERVVQAGAPVREDDGALLLTDMDGGQVRVTTG